METSQKLDSEEKVVEHFGYDIIRAVRTGALKPIMPWWEARDVLRFFTEEFKEIPDAPKISNHQLHVSNEDPNSVAYCPDVSYAKADRFIRMRYGKYLAKFTSYTNNYIKELVADFQVKFGTPEINFATTEEAIEWVYENGPESCMRRDRGYIRSDYHPCTVYATPDVTLAYVKNSKGRVAARTLLNEVYKTYTRIYGESSTLIAGIEQMGYTCNSHGLLDCRLSKIEDMNGEWLMPYLDGINEVDSFNDKYWKVIRNGDHDCDTTTGWLNPDVDRCTCDECGGRTNEENMTYIEAEDISVCPGCMDTEFVYAYGNCDQELVRINDAVYINDTWYIDDGEVLAYHNIHWVYSISEYRHMDDTVFSEYEDEYILIENAVRIDDGEDYVQEQTIADNVGRYWVDANNDFYTENDGFMTPLSYVALQTLWNVRSTDNAARMYPYPLRSVLNLIRGRVAPAYADNFHNMERLERFAKEHGYELDLTTYQWIYEDPDEDEDETTEWRNAA